MRSKQAEPCGDGLDQAVCGFEAAALDWRVILSQAEVEIARSFATASQSYQNNPVALQLRAMNMLYEGLKERGGLMVVPSSAVESLGMGGLMGAAAMGQAHLAASAKPLPPGQD